MEPLVPGYRAGSLADVVPSLLAGLGLPGTSNDLGLPEATKICLLLVDGLGWELLRAHPTEAPFLTSLTTGRAPLAAGFPATTATSIATIGTGVPPGEHGIVGYSLAVGRDDLVLNALGWHRHGDGRPVDLRSQVVPEEFQPRRTVWERAEEAGVAVHMVAHRDQDGSGLTRAVLRGGRFHGTHALGDLTSGAVAALQAGGRVLCYAYHGDLDALGHLHGPGSDPWRHQLAHVDQLAAAVAGRLPADGMLVVTADHGMVSIGEDDRVDLDTEAPLREGVRMIGGEARVRHLHTEPGATADVLAAWRERLGDRAWIVRRDQAVEADWFGPVVADHLRPRIGDLVVAARGTLGLTRSRAESRLSGFVGQHGSLTAEEQLVPLLAFRNP
ncbi:alkaline phosphatase family protein [Actinoalloteichus caeruleus]|uniref:alkaline phosphatase family protein n=1 Tax=Actinoalloteichus cyanogriseus TaxID=2893586 RepID=UPI003AAE1AD9